MDRALPSRLSRPAGEPLLGRLAWPAAVLAACVLLLAVVVVPALGVAAVVGAGVAAVAAWTPAAPLAIWNADPLVSLLTVGRLPAGGTVALFSAWTLLALIIAVVRGRRGAVGFGSLVDLSGVAIVGLTGLLAVRLVSSDAYAYGLEKLQLFGLKVLLPFVLAVLVGAVRRDLRLFVVVALVMGVATALYDVAQVLTGGAAEEHADRLTLAEGIDPIGLARLMAQVILLLLYALSRTEGSGRRALLVAALLPTLVALLAAGSRGPLTAVVLAAPLLVLTRIRDPRSFKRLVGTIAVGLLIGGAAISATVPPETTARALSAFGGTDETTEANQRATLWGQAVDAVPDDVPGVLFGIGTGGFASVNPTESYPHNVVLELLLETGVLGVALFVLGVASAFHRLGGLAFRSDETGALAGLILSLFTLDLINAMFSGDVAGNGSLWTWIGFGSGLVAAERVAGRRRRDVHAGV